MSNAGRAAQETRKREITMQYRGKEIKVEVDSLRGELSKRTACMVKSVAAASGCLPALSWEKEVFEEAGKDEKSVGCEKLLKKFKSAREAAEELAKVAEGLTFGDLLHKYSTKLDYLQEIDSSFVIEVKLLEWAAEKGARERLQSKILSILPAASKRVTLQKATEQMSGLQDLWLFKLLAPGDQAVATTCQEILAKMMRGQAPA
eukprot:1921521-Amphidinium_carterae.1